MSCGTYSICLYLAVQVTRSLAPLGADRFLALVQGGFFNQTAEWRDDAAAVFRVVPGFVIQFGISGKVLLQKIVHHSIREL